MPTVPPTPAATPTPAAPLGGTISLPNPPPPAASQPPTAHSQPPTATAPSPSLYEAITDYIDATNAGMNRRADPRDAILNLPEDAPDPAKRHIAAQAFEAITGIRSPDGSILTPGRTPLDAAAYAAKVRDILKRGTASLRSPEYQAWLDIPEDDEERRYQTALAALSPIRRAAAKFGASVEASRAEHADPDLRAIDSLYRASLGPTPPAPAPSDPAAPTADSPLPTATAPDAPETRASVIAEYEAKLAADHFLERYAAAAPALSEPARDIIRRAAQSGSRGILTQDAETFRTLPKKEQRVASSLISSALPPRSRNFLRDIGLGILDLAERMTVNLARQTEDMGFQPPPPMFGTAASYARLAEIAAERSAMSQEQRDAERLTANLWQQASTPRAFDSYSIVEEAFIGAATTVPYMLMAGIPYIGTPLVAIDQAQNVRDRVLLEGGDPNQAQAAQWAAAIAYAYIEKLSFHTAFGKPLSTLGMRSLFLNVSRHGYAYAARQIGTEIAGVTVAETIEEMLQRATEEATVAGLLNKDIAAAAARGFIEEAQTWNTMLLIGGLGTAKKAASAKWARASNLDLAETVTARLRALTAIQESSGLPQPKSPDTQKRLALARKIWTEAPSDLQALARLQSELDLDRDRAIAIADYFGLENALLHSTRTPEGRKQYRQAISLDPAFLQTLLPGATITPLTPDPAAPTAPTADSPLPTATATAANPEPKKTITRKRTLPNGRRVTQELPNPAHAAWLSARQETSKPAPAPADTTADRQLPTATAPSPAPAPQRYRLDFPVTLPDGTRSTASYTIEAGALDPDLSTPATAAEVQKITGGSVRADDYLAMTPEQQAEILAANGLAVRSQWKLTAPDGSSATTSGLISLVTSPGPGTARATNLDLIHEHLHAVAGILKAAGVLTPERVATMRQLFGDPTYAGEDFDEESAAEALAANLLGRDPHPEAKPIFSAIRAGARRLLETLKVIPPEAELSARAQALDIAFEALRSGDLSLLDPFSGITFADETDAAPAPSDPAASRGTATSVSSAPDAQSTNIPPAEGDDPDASAAAVEAARAAVPPHDPAAHSQLPTAPAPATASTRTGLRAEIAALNDKVDRLMQLLASGAPIPASRPTGQSVSIVTPTGNIRFAAEWHAAELDDLVTSDNPGYPQEFQPRDRSTVTSRVQVLKFSAPGAFDPERLFDSAESDGGSPITAGGLTVISGNGRVMILREVASAGRWQEYDTAARAFAARAGITIPDGMRRPVLVRRVTSVADRETLVKIAELSNRPKILQRNESELAEADAKLITPDLVSIYAPGSDANLLAASNAPFMQAFARAAQAEGDLDSNGKPTQALAMRVRNAFLAALLGEGADTRDLIRTLIEQSGELGMRTLLNSLIDHAGPAIALHHAKPELSILDALRAAVRSYVSWKTSGTRATLADHLAQGDLLAAPPSTALAIMLTAAEQGRLGPLLDRYAELARAIDTQTADMFGASPDPTPLIQKAEEDTRPAGAPAASSRPPPRPPAPPPPRPEPAARFTPAPLQPTAIDTPENVPTWTLLGTAGKAVPTANAPDSDRSDQIPLFQGGKRSLAARAEAAIKRLMTPSERARYPVIWEGFGGSGGWGLYHANTSLPNVREISIGEFNPSRMAKIKFFHTQGHRLAEVEASPEFQAFKARVFANMTKRNKDGETVAATSARKLAASISNTIKENGPQLSDDVIAVAQAIADRAANGSQDAADTRELIYDRVLEGVIKDAAAIQSAAQEFRDRGGTFTYRTQRDTYKADLIPGSNVFTIIDPPYYLTSDYDEENATTSGKVGIDTYQQTLELIRRSAAAGNAVLYTDSAWWATKEFTPQPAEILLGETHSTEQKILLDIFNTLDHLDIVDGKVGQRKEIIGVHHAHTTEAATATGQRSLRSTDEPARREQTDGPIPAPAGNGSVRDQDIPGVAKGDAGQAAALRSANDPGRDLAAPAASSRPPLPTAPATAPSPDPRFSLAQRDAAADITPEQRQRNLARFLSGSHVRHVVYHATMGNFSTFELSDKPHGVPAAYFSDDPGAASSYPALVNLEYPDQPGANIMPVYLSLKNPLVIDESQQHVSHAEFLRLAEQAKQEGKDGIIVYGALDDQNLRYGPDGVDTSRMETAADASPTNLYVVFSPNQIKSATGNRGTYDRRSPDIRFSLQPRETDPLGLYSRLREHLRAKMPARATAETLRNLTDPAKGHGIRADELRWTGFQDFLDALPPGSTVTKEAALAAVADPPLQETVLAKPNADDEYLRPHIERVAANAAEWKTVWPRYPFSDLNEEERLEFAWANRLDVANHVQGTNNDTSYEQYTTPGAVPGTYRERLIVLTPPASDTPTVYQSSHWPATPNVLLHIRHADRLLPDGATALDAEEFQSDWHQDGREKGYRPRNQAEYNKHILSKYPTLPADPDEWSYPMLQEAGLTTDEIAHLSDQASDARVPPAPYADTSKGWATLAARRILRIAAERGLRTVTWTTGRTQIERFEDSFRQAVDEMEWHTARELTNNLGKDQQIQRLQVRKNKSTVVIIEYNPDGSVTAPVSYVGKHLSAVIGKDAATKVLAAPDGRLSGDDLHIGGEGMIEFYDRIMPRVFAALGKPYAAAPSTVTLTEDAKSLAAVNERAREIADHIAEYGEYESLDLSEDNLASRVFSAIIDDPELSFSAAIDNERAADPDNSEKAERDALVRFVGQGPGSTRHRFDIPPAMSADILAGQPRFSLQPRNPASDPEWARPKTAEIIGYRSTGSSPDGTHGTFYTIAPQNRETTRTVLRFNQMLDVPHALVDAFEGLPAEGLAPLWFPGVNFASAAEQLDLDSDGEAMDYLVAREARRRGYDGIKYGDLEVVDLRHHPIPAADTADSQLPLPTATATRFSIRRTSRRNPASNVEALITARILAGKPAAPADVAAILKNAGIRTVDTPEQILDRANARAQALPAAEAGRIRAADPALFERLANDAERDRLAARIGESFGAGAQAAAPAIGAAAGLALARERTARAAIESAAGFTAAEMQAELGIDLAATVLNTPDIQPTPAELDARANEREAARREAELNADLDAEADPAPLPPSPEMTALLNQVLAAAEARAAAEALERQRRDMEKQRKAARRAESTDDPALDDDPDAEPAPATEPDPVYRLVAPLISNPDEFAQFIREWVRRRLAKTRPEDDPAAPFRHPAALRDLQRTAQHILADLARQLLGTGGPRIAAEHAIARLADAPTERSTIRDIADIYSRIHRGALRESRTDMISRLQREIARLAKDTGRWQENKEDLRRKVTAATERWARTLSEYIALSPDRLLGETRRLQKIIADADTDPADPAAPSDTDDRKLREALDKLAILQTYGGMINWMPGQIAEAADSITAHLNGERQAHEARRLEAEAAAARIRGTLIKAVINPDESAPAPEPGGLSRFADSLIGNLQLRLNYLIRFAKATDRAAALDAINDIMTELGRGAEQYRVIQSDAHDALGTALEQIYGDRRAAARRLDTPIPAAAQAALSRQGVRLTYGRAIQLYASILQRHYAENVRIHKRARDLDTLRTVLDSRDLALHQWLVAWYDAQRGRLSEAQQLVTGCPVLSEDRLYMPAVILREPSGFRGRHAAWTPIAASLTPRVRHRLDFDERASVLDVFADRLEDNALIRAYGPRGIFLRDAVAHQSVQSAVTRFHGSAQRSALMNQIEDTLRGGRQVTRSDAWLAPANTARRWITRFYLPGNVVSAAKQIASVPVWANIVGFRNLARYMFDIDSAAIRELMQSPGFRARYASGWSEETANILSDHRRNPVAKLYDAGLLPNRTVDAVAGLWIAQGVYRDLKATLTDRGYSADEARSRAQTLTWNLIEQTQQSARTEMLLLIQREQPLTRVLFQFANSPIQQMQFELEAFREFKAGTPGSRPRLARALIINHVLVPAILLTIEGFFNALLGRQPEDDRWRHWLVASLLGQFSALFIIGSLGERGLITLLGGKYPYWKTDELPLAGIKRPFQSAFDLIRDTALYGADAITPGDFGEVAAADILTDLHNLGRATVAPYRHISEAVRNRRD